MLKVKDINVDVNVNEVNENGANVNVKDVTVDVNVDVQNPHRSTFQTNHVIRLLVANISFKAAFMEINMFFS